MMSHPLHHTVHEDLEPRLRRAQTGHVLQDRTTTRVNPDREFRRRERYDPVRELGQRCGPHRLSGRSRPHLETQLRRLIRDLRVAPRRGHLRLPNALYVAARADVGQSVRNGITTHLTIFTTSADARQ